MRIVDNLQLETSQDVGRINRGGDGADFAGRSRSRRSLVRSALQRSPKS